MTIQVLGSGCPTCKKLLERTTEAVKQLGLQATVDYITNVQKILDMGLMCSPVLAIDGKPILVGEVPTADKLKQVIQDNLKVVSV
jgi:small redox-active disulfide protein 2